MAFLDELVPGDLIRIKKGYDLTVYRGLKSSLSKSLDHSGGVVVILKIHVVHPHLKKDYEPWGIGTILAEVLVRDQVLVLWLGRDWNCSTSSGPVDPHIPANWFEVVR